jgi:hypothetical protein
MKLAGQLMVSQESLREAFDLVQGSMTNQIAKKGSRTFASMHEAYGVLAEELNLEALREIRANSRPGFTSEMIDVAVGAIWAVATAREWDRQDAPRKNP